MHRRAAESVAKLWREWEFFTPDAMSSSSALEWLGRQGTKAVAASLAVGIAIPPLAAALKPLFPPAIFLLLVFAFLRVDPLQLRARFSAPLKVAAASAWTMVAIPVAIGLAFLWFDPDRIGPGLALGVMMYAAAPPVLSSTAFSALLRLDAALSLAVLIVCTAATPIVAPLLISYFAGGSLAIDTAQLALRLAVFLGGAFATALLLRRIAGQERIAANGGVIDGISVILLIVFGIALMDGITERAIRDPALVFGLTAFAFAMAIALYALTSLIFWREGAERSLALGFSAAHRNMAVMIAAAGGGLPELTWIYFAAAQFPIYLVPLMVTPVVHRILNPRLPGG
jgi:predicted Na+-dependent transporter